MTAFVTGSRRRDLALFLVLATGIVLGSLRLAVYYRAPDSTAPTAAPFAPARPAIAR